MTWVFMGAIPINANGKCWYKTCPCLPASFFSLHTSPKVEIAKQEEIIGEEHFVCAVEVHIYWFASRF